MFFMLLVNVQYVLVFHDNFTYSPVKISMIVNKLQQNLFSSQININDERYKHYNIKKSTAGKVENIVI